MTMVYIISLGAVWELWSMLGQ